MSSLPTIKVHVSPARKKSAKRKTDEITKRNKVVTLQSNDNTAKRTTEEKSPDRSKKILKKPLQTSPKKIESSRAIAMEQEDPKRTKKSRKYMVSDDLENAPLEEYIPDAPKAKRSCPDFKYVPSRKSALESMRLTSSNEYTPTICDSKCIMESINYVPNSIEKLKTIHETYEPCATTMIPEGILEEYVPNSKGIKPSVEEYEPGFKSPSKLMKFDESYVPSSVRQGNNSKRMNPSKSEKFKAHRKGTLLKKKTDLFS